MFNTLNSIYSLALKRSEQTPDAIIKLSELMRYMLTECTSTLVDLTKEVDVLYHYVALEKVRFADRVDIITEVHGDLIDKKIPPLLLMPFLENSFKHGANERMEQAWISMTLHVAGSQLEFKLMNGKPENNESQVLSSRLGLMNVQRRLHLLYPGSHELRITEDDDTYIISLTIDLDRVKIPELT
jgi:LytS/YehU family sensor histidine kinase